MKQKKLYYPKTTKAYRKAVKNFSDHKYDSRAQTLKDFNSSKSFISNFLGFIFFFMLINLLIDFFKGDTIQIPTFTSLLELISSDDIPVINMPFLDFSFNTSSGLLGSIFGGLFDFVVNIINILGFIVGGLIQAVIYITYFLRWLFL